MTSTAMFVASTIGSVFDRFVIVCLYPFYSLRLFLIDEVFNVSHTELPELMNRTRTMQASLGISTYG